MNFEYLSIYTRNLNNLERKLDNEANYHTCVETEKPKTKKVKTLIAIQSYVEANAKQNAYLFPNTSHFLHENNPLIKPNTPILRLNLPHLPILQNHRNHLLP